MSVPFDPYHKWLGILPKDQPPHHYRLLGVETFEDDLQVIEAAADRQLGYLRKFQSGEHAADCQKLLNEVSRARLCLLKPAAKADYDEQLRDQLEMPPEELIEFEPLVATASRSRSSSGPGLVAWASAGVLVLLVIGGLAFFLRGKGPRNAPAPPAIVDGESAVAPPGSGSNSVVDKVSSGTKPDARGVIDILPLLKPEHIVKGRWKTEASRLESLDVYHQNGQILLPVDVPPTYTLYVTGIRLTEPGINWTTLGVGLVCGQSDCLFAMETKPPVGTSGLQQLDGKDWDNNPTTLPGSFTKVGVPFELEVIVRDKNIEVRVDGRTIVDWHGDFSRLNRAPNWNSAEPHKLFLAAESQYAFTKLTLGPPLPPRKLPGGDLKPGESIELLKFVDLKQDVWNGDWMKDGGTLKAAGTTDFSRFSVPFQVPEEYELAVDFQSEFPIRDFYMGLPFRQGHAGLGLGGDNGETNVLTVDLAAINRNPYLYHNGQFLASPRAQVKATVRKNHIVIRAGDSILFDWKGDPRRFMLLREWATPGNRVTVGCRHHNLVFQIHSLQLTRLAPSTAVFPNPSPPGNGDLLASVNVDRDTTHGHWTKTELGLQCDSQKNCGLRFPAKLPADYEFRCVLQRKENIDAMLMAVPVAGQRVQFVLDAFYGKTSGIEWIDGKKAQENSTTLQHPEPKLPLGQATIVQGRVVGRHLTIEVGGQQLWDLDIPDNLIDPPNPTRAGWLTREENLQLFVGSWFAGVEILEARFRPLDKTSPPFPPLNIAGLTKPTAPNNPGPAGDPQAAKSPNPDQPLVGEGLLSTGATPVPDTAAQEAALKKLRELFKEQYANSKKDPEKLGLSQKLETLGGETRDDPAVKFVCLDEARKLAADVGDLAKAFALVEALSTEFKIDVLETKSSTLKTAAPKLKGPLLNKEFVDKALPLVDQLLLAEQIENAIDIANIAVQSANKVKDKTLLSAVQEVRKEADELAKEFSLADKARQTLLTNADDGPAKLVWGRWVCLHQGKWTEGLKLLQGVGDEKLTELASRDLKDPADKEAVLQLGSDWLDYAKSRKDHSLANFATRALYWLSKAHADSTGLMKTRLESLMEQAVTARDWDSPMIGLLDLVGKKVVQRKYVQSREIRQSEGTPFREVPPEGGVLVGFDFYIGKWENTPYIGGLQPVYATLRGIKKGEIFGSATGPLVEIRARRGYAVNGISCQAGIPIENIQVTFARVAKQGLDPKRTYTSGVVGRPPTLQMLHVVNSGNQPIVGVFGQAREYVHGLGIIMTQ